MKELDKLEKLYALNLPTSYKNWFDNGGQKTKSLIGSDVDFPRLSELQDWSKELLKEDGSDYRLPEKSFVFFMHQGYQFMYFDCAEGDDPEVWYYYEGDMVPKLKWNSFSEFVKTL